MKPRFWILGVLLLCILATVVFTKPLRILAPEWFGLTCVTKTLCIQDIERLSEAQRLREDAVAFVEAELGPFRKEPRVLFCGTQACFAQFFDPRAKGMNLGTMGAVINESGWSAHILRHELIHYWQTETFGFWNTARDWPRWFIEGMAYTLSLDPRPTIPNEAAQGYRSEFIARQAEGFDWRKPDF